MSYLIIYQKKELFFSKFVESVWCEMRSFLSFKGSSYLCSSCISLGISILLTLSCLGYSPREVNQSTYHLNRDVLVEISGSQSFPYPYPSQSDLAGNVQQIMDRPCQARDDDMISGLFQRLQEGHPAVKSRNK